MPTTPSGTRICPTWMPLGRTLSSLISPTGSASAAISRTPSAIAATLAATSVSRSTNAASLPAARAAATSSALAASRLFSSRMIASAIASSAAFFAAVGARARARDAARARSPTSRMYAGKSRPGTLRLVMPIFYPDRCSRSRTSCRVDETGRRWRARSELVRVERFDAGIGPDQDDVGAAIGEQAVGDHTDDVVDLHFELGRIQDAHVLDIEDDVAVVGDEVRTQLRVSAKLDQLVRGEAARHRNYLDRQRKVAQHADQFRLVDDAHELLRHRGDDLFPGQRAAAALDHRTVLGYFVGAVDVDGQRVDGGELEHGDAVTLQPFRGLDRAGNRAFDAMLYLRQLVDEVVGGRAAAHANVGVVDDVLDRLAGDQMFLLVLGHDFLRGGGRSVQTPSNASAANPIDSLNVGCGWMVLPMSTASAPISMARTISLIRSPACVPTMAPPTTRCVASSKRSLVKPSSRPLAMARPDAAHGKTLFCTLMPLALASSSVSPTHAISGSVYATEGMTRASKNDFSPAAASAATCASCTALCASIGWPTISPMA